MSEPFSNFLHIYPQWSYHCPIQIRGTQEALTALRDALILALDSGQARCSTSATDGEGYTIEISNHKHFGSIGTPFYVDIEVQEAALRRLEYDRKYHLTPHVQLTIEGYKNLCAKAGEQPSRFALMWADDESEPDPQIPTSQP